MSGKNVVTAEEFSGPFVERSAGPVPVARKPQASRKDAPVFVLGCVRSGTHLLYHMLLSAGDFAVYRTESNALNLLEPRFGSLGVRRNQETF